MEILKFEGSSRAPLKQKKSFRVILGITVMGVFAALGSTLAANITINSGPVEFGQGLAAASACDGSINVGLTSTFANSSDTRGTFSLSALAFTNVDYSACSAKELVISAYDSGSATAVPLGGASSGTDSYTAVIVSIGNDSASVKTPTSNVSLVSSNQLAGNNDTFTVTFTNPKTQAGNIYKVTVESRDRT